MSYSSLYVVNSDGKVAPRKEYRNGWGYAMPAWTYLAKKYLSRPDDKEYDLTTRWWVRGEGKPVFDLKNDPRLERWEQIVLQATFDHVIVLKENFQEVVDAFRKMDETLREEHPDQINHYGAMAADVEALIKGSRITGVCWQATSVSADQWRLHEECTCKCGDIHETPEDRAYDIQKDKKHYFLFDELKAVAPS